MPVTPGPQDPAAAGREQVIEVLKAAFVQERLAKDEFEAPFRPHPGPPRVLTTPFHDHD